MSYSTTKSEATQNASKLVAILNARKPGWKAHVWENLGWHYSAINTKYGLSVYGYSDGYHAMLDPSYAVFYDVHKNFRDPHKAVEYAIKNASSYGKEIAKCVAKFNSYLS